MAEKKNYSVPALEKAIMILNALGENVNLSITEIHQRLDIPKSTTFVILNTLEKHKMIEKSGEGKFRLGPSVFHLGMAFYQQIDIRSVARNHLERLIRDTPYTAHLAVLINQKPVYIDKVEGNSFVRFNTSVGQALPLHASGVGKALAAGMSDEEIAEAINGTLYPMTFKSYRTIEEVLKDIHQVRIDGFAIEDEQMEEGVRCIGAPIYGPSGKVVASISITALSKDLPLVAMKERCGQVAETAAHISRDLGYLPTKATLF